MSIKNSSKFIVSFIFICANNFLFAQDTLYRRNGSISIVKVIIVKETEIIYKPYEFKSNPLQYRILKNYVLKIKYKNGWLDTFNINAANTLPITKIDKRKIDFGQNLISTNIIDPEFGFISIVYERTFKSGDFSYGIPLSLGLIDFGVSNVKFNRNPSKIDYYNRNKIFNTGLQFSYYPFKQATLCYFLGIATEYGQSKQLWYDALLFRNGFLFQPSKHFNILSSISVGGYKSRNGKQSTGGGATGRFELNLGYKF